MSAMFSPDFPTLAASLIFGEPGWFWALALVPALAFWFLRAERRARTKLARIVSPRLRAQLTDGVQPGRRRLRYALLLAGMSLLVVAAARPQIGFDSLEVKRRGLDLMIAIDTSKSMLATDVEPNRLTRAKLAAQDLIALSQGDRLGLIAFAGRAFLQAPLTIDYGAVIAAVQDLDTDAVPRGGTNIAEAIQLALDAFGKGEGSDRALVLMTDGEELEADAVTMAKKAAMAGVKIFALGIGSSEGSLLPLPGGGFVRDRAGQMVRSRLDESRLSEIAAATDGRYMRLTAGPEAIAELYRDGISQLKRKELEMKTTQRPIERYAWPLSAALVLISMGALLRERRSPPRPTARASRKKAARSMAAALFTLLGVAAIPGAFAASNAPTASEAMRQYRDGKYGDAESNFESLGRQHPNSARYQFNLGAAAYKKGDYARAAEAFGRALAMPDRALHETTFYNLGNTLYQQGAAQKESAAKLRDWGNAIAHYDNALRLNPKDGDALANRAFVQRAIEEEKTRQPPPPQKGGGDDKSKSSKSDQQKSKDKDKRDKNKDQSKDKDASKPDSSQDPQKNDDASAKPEANDSSSVPDKSDPQSEENRPPKGDETDAQEDSADSNGQQRSGRDSVPPPAPAQENRPQGDFQAREPQPGEQQEVAEAGEPKDDGGGKLTAAQARQLLEALKGEDDKILLNDKLRRQESTYKDW
jgi:Ca-activated chloride channel homolog